MIARFILSLALLSSVASAQTYQQKLGSVVNCQLSTDHCPNIPMTSGDQYTFGSSEAGNVWAGQQFVWSGTQGAIDSVAQDFCQIVNEACQFEFDIRLATGRTATVSGIDTMRRAGRWIFYEISGSTVTFH